MTWTTVLDPVLSAGDTGWNGYNVRTSITNSAPTGRGSQYRFTFTAGSGGAVIDHAFIGRLDPLAGTVNFETTPDTITFSGSNSVTIGANASVVSDAITTWLGSAGSVVSTHFSGTTGLQTSTLTGISSKYQASIAADKLTMATSNTNSSLLDLIEAQGTEVAPTYSYSYSKGRGNRSSSITVTTTATMGGGAIANLVDGSRTDNTWFGAGQSTKQVLFDFTTAATIQEARWIQDSAVSQGTWQWEGSNDNSSYTSLGSTFTLGATDVTLCSFGGNTTAYRYYRLRQTAGTTSSSPFIREVEFQIAAPVTLTTLSAAVGTFTETGVAATETFTRKDTTTVGTFALTGVAQALKVNHVLSTATGTFTETGVAATETFTRKSTTTVGAFALTGVAATETLTRKDTTAVGTFALTGVAQTLKVNHVLSAGTGAFALAGVAATETFTRKSTTTVGAFALTGVAQTLKVNHVLSPAAGAFALTGVAQALTKARLLAAGTGTFALGGVAETITEKHVLSPGTGIFALTGVAQTLKETHQLTGGTGAFTLTGVAQTLGKIRTLATAAGAFALTGVAQTLKPTRTLSPAKGTFTLTGVAATFTAKYPLAAGTGAFTLTGVAQTLKPSRILSPAKGTFTLAGIAQALKETHKLFPATGAFALTGVAQVLRPSRILSVGKGIFNENGNPTGLVRTRVATAVRRTYILTGKPITITIKRIVGGKAQYIMSPAAGAFTLTGVPATPKVPLRHLLPARGVFTLNGAAIQPTQAHIMQVTRGVFLLNTPVATATFGVSHTVFVGSGMFAVSSPGVALQKNNILRPGTGAFSLIGNPSTLSWGRALLTGYGAFTINPFPIREQRALKLFPRADLASAFVLSGVPVTLTRLSASGPPIIPLGGIPGFAIVTAVAFADADITLSAKAHSVITCDLQALATVAPSQQADAAISVTQ